MRGAALGVALAVLVAACGAVPVAGSRQVVVEVTNTEATPVVLTIVTPTAVFPGAVQPSSLAAGGTGVVTLFVPPGQDTWLEVNGVGMFDTSDITAAADECAGKVQVEVSANGSGGLACGP